MIKQLRMFLLVTASIIGCNPMQYSFANDANQFSRDAEILRSALFELYPSLDRYGQVEGVSSALERLDEIAATTNEPMEFYRTIVDVAVATRDEHVIPFPAENYRKARREGKMMVPYAIQWVGGVPFIGAVADPAFEKLVGREIVAFDSYSAAKVRDRLKATIPSDGLSETFALRRLQDFTPTQNENYFDLNYPIWFGERDVYKLTVNGPGDKVETFELEALDWATFSQFYRRRLPRKAPVEFRWVENDVAYLSVLSFHDWYFVEHSIDAEERFAEIFGEIAKRPGTTLILDLRRNEGGGDISSLLLDFVMDQPFAEYDQILTSFVGQPDAARYCDNASEVIFDPTWSLPASNGLFQLKPEFRHLITGAAERAPSASAFQGKIVVLISGATGSAAVKVAAVLDRYQRATFIGEETGGAAAGATAFGYCTLTLPNTGIRVDIPLIRFERDQNVEYGRGVLPDTEIDAGLVPPVSMGDAILAAAIKWINSSLGDE